ncbi:uncharacterized protein LOC132316616 [Cornus florida]|uniref:uncharacterized protein LOC132316616 n=1 Tax=Cornus florida TaxID=4283 RepID=UPI00289C5A16|nr:uncharacterized protein LOC132316616 [Cornus florida]
MPPRRDLGESSSSNLVERDQEQVEEDVLLRVLVPPSGGQARGTNEPLPQISEVVPPPAPPPEKSESVKTLYHIAEFVKLMLTLFKGGPDPLVVDNFMERVEKHLNAMNLVSDRLKIILATYNFTGDAKIWWKTVSHIHNLDTMTYDAFKKLYYEKYFLAPKWRELKKEFDVRKTLVVEVESKDNKAIAESYKHNGSMSVISEGQSHKKQRNEPSGFKGQQSARFVPAASVSIRSSSLNVTCFRCGQPGHYKSQCTQTQTVSSGCFGCGQQGHRVRDCP